MTATGADQNDGVVIISKHSFPEDCLEECKTHLDATGCEYHSSDVCAYHTKEVADGSKDEDYYCWVNVDITSKVPF